MARPPSERIRHGDPLKRVRATGAVNSRPSSSSTTVCTESWSTESRHKLNRRGPSPRRPPCPLYTKTLRSQCDFFRTCSAIFFISEVALLSKKDYLRKTTCDWLCGYDAALTSSYFYDNFVRWRPIFIILSLLTGQCLLYSVYTGNAIISAFLGRLFRDHYSAPGIAAYFNALVSDNILVKL